MRREERENVARTRGREREVWCARLLLTVSYWSCSERSVRSFTSTTRLRRDRAGWGVGEEDAETGWDEMEGGEEAEESEWTPSAGAAGARCCAAPVELCDAGSRSPTLSLIAQQLRSSAQPHPSRAPQRLRRRRAPSVNEVSGCTGGPDAE